jgi:CRP/FNR family transcriptional regulator
VTFRPGECITRRHEVSQRILIVCGGWVFRHFELPDERRQILRFLLPGDPVSIGPIAEKTHYSTTALTKVQLSSFDRQDLIARCMASREFRDALTRAGVEEIRSANELSVILGQFSAEQRIAYLFLDLTRRIAQRAVIRDHRYALPLRQQHIADAVGLTAVHVSRVLGAFRERRICDLSEGMLSVLNPAELGRIGSIE